MENILYLLNFIAFFEKPKLFKILDKLYGTSKRYIYKLINFNCICYCYNIIGDELLLNFGAKFQS